MIAITDTSAFADVELVLLTQNVALTSTIVDQELTGSVIKNATITTAVKTLLKSILGNSDLTTAAKNKIAEYAGFSHNSTTNTVDFTSADVSLDKLTFYVIFKLPYTHANFTYEDIADGETSSTIATNPTTWGKYANYIRNLTGSDIKKINSAGEQVNSSGKPVDGSSVDIEGWYKEEAYSYLGETPFNGTYTVPAGLNSVATEKAMLFGQNDETAVAGEASLDITKIPLYFYLLAKVENPYLNRYWLNSNINSQLISRIPHWPSGIKTKVYRKHFVKESSNPDNVTVANATYTLAHDTTGTFFNITQTDATTNQQTTHKVYIEEMDTASLTFEGLSLSDADEVIKDSDGLRAVWKDKYDHPTLNNNSGLTFGMGVDIGATFQGYYNIEIDIQFSGTGTFRLYYGGRRSAPINVNVSCTSLRNTIRTLIEDTSQRTKVTNSTGGTSGTPAKIKILRQYASNQKAYNHRIYVEDETGTASVTLSPNAENDRWKERTVADNDDWYYYNEILNYSFSNNPTPGYYEHWELQTPGSYSDILDRRKYLKRSFGCRSKASYHIWDEQKDLINDIEIKSYTRNLRATYHKFFVPRFYDLKRTLKDGTQKFNGSSGKDSVQYLLNDSRLKTKPNQAELFAIVLLNYNYPSEYRRKLKSLIDAINQHSISKLKSAINKLTKDRKDALNSFIGPSVKSKLYHGIED
ncbi:hypothetical protein KAOT1_01115 [Kordia algicida OT-1]|uniref:Uncharacterized protein n=1 Tax=Kordia algicida OT-1 TaxID=391587 RepID=A9E8M0_9FLAO|nr:hypothetical protein [Kordia algicida]EDP94783.1 hypothetical protein KAOT1_01115 [Kordia algicida OT-1]